MEVSNSAVATPGELPAKERDPGIKTPPSLLPTDFIQDPTLSASEKSLLKRRIDFKKTAILAEQATLAPQVKTKLELKANELGLTRIGCSYFLSIESIEHFKFLDQKMGSIQEVFSSVTNQNNTCVTAQEIEPYLSCLFKFKNDAIQSSSIIVNIYELRDSLVHGMLRELFTQQREQLAHDIICSLTRVVAEKSLQEQDVYANIPVIQELWKVAFKQTQSSTSCHSLSSSIRSIYNFCNEPTSQTFKTNLRLKLKKLCDNLSLHFLDTLNEEKVSDLMLKNAYIFFKLGSQNSTIGDRIQINLTKNHLVIIGSTCVKHINAVEKEACLHNKIDAIREGLIALSQEPESSEHKELFLQYLRLFKTINDCYDEHTPPTRYPYDGRLRAFYLDQGDYRLFKPLQYKAQEGKTHTDIGMKFNTLNTISAYLLLNKNYELNCLVCTEALHLFEHYLRTCLALRAYLPKRSLKDTAEKRKIGDAPTKPPLEEVFSKRLENFCKDLCLLWEQLIEPYKTNHQIELLQEHFEQFLNQIKTYPKALPRDILKQQTDKVASKLITAALEEI